MTNTANETLQTEISLLDLQESRGLKRGIKIMKNDTVAKYAITETMFKPFEALGYKVLLKNYNCPLGEVDYVAKKKGYLCFIGINKKLTSLEAVAKYYIKRYGIDSVPYRILAMYA